MGLGRVKTPACNLRVEIPSRFRQLENQKYCDDYQEKTTEKTILRILGSCTFSRSQGHSRQEERRRWRRRHARQRCWAFLHCAARGHT
jgi:hypothetical protein